jgi:hypothetical protein
LGAMILALLLFNKFLMDRQSMAEIRCHGLESSLQAQQITLSHRVSAQAGD